MGALIRAPSDVSKVRRFADVEGGGCATAERLAFGCAHGDPYGAEDALAEVEVAIGIVPAHEAAIAFGCIAEHPAEESAAGEGEFAVVYAYESAVGAVAIDAAGDVDAAVAVDDFSAVGITYVRQIFNGDAGTEFRRGGNAAGNAQVLDGGTLEVAEGRTAVFTIGFEVDVKRSAVAVERSPSLWQSSR